MSGYIYQIRIAKFSSLNVYPESIQAFNIKNTFPWATVAFHSNYYPYNICYDHIRDRHQQSL